MTTLQLLDEYNALCKQLESEACDPILLAKLVRETAQLEAVMNNMAVITAAMPKLLDETSTIKALDDELHPQQ